MNRSEKAAKHKREYHDRLRHEARIRRREERKEFIATLMAPASEAQAAGTDEEWNFSQKVALHAERRWWPLDTPTLI